MDDFEISEEDLLLMDQQFLQSMDEKNVEHAQQDSTDQQSFLIVVVLLLLLVLGICLAVFWIVKGYRVRKRKRRSIVLYNPA